MELNKSPWLPVLGMHFLHDRYQMYRPIAVLDLTKRFITRVCAKWLWACHALSHHKSETEHTYLIAELTMLMWSHGNRAPLERLKSLYKETPTEDSKKLFGKKGAESFGKIKSFIWAFILLCSCLTQYWSYSLVMFPDQFLRQLLWVLKFLRSFF